MEENIVEKLDLLIDVVAQLAQPTYFDWLTLLISSVAVVVSGLAIYFAILVPKTLANQKNRISLFEKRYEMYLLYLDLHGIFYTIRQDPNRNDHEVLVQALNQLKRQQGFQDSFKFYNYMLTALDSPRYFFSFDTSDPRYQQFHEGVQTALLLQRGTNDMERLELQGDTEGIFLQLDFFLESVKAFERYFYICPPKNKK